MAVARAVTGVLLVTFLVTFAALYVAGRATRFPQREVVTPDAWRALERQDPERAASLFNDALTERPNDPVLHLGVGSAAYALGRTEAALGALKKAVSLDPDFAEAQIMFGPGRVCTRRQHACHSLDGEGGNNPARRRRRCRTSSIAGSGRPRCTSSSLKGRANISAFSTKEARSRASAIGSCAPSSASTRAHRQDPANVTGRDADGRALHGARLSRHHAVAVVGVWQL